MPGAKVGGGTPLSGLYEDVLLKKKQKANCGDKHKEIQTRFWKEKRLYLDVSYVPTYIFRSSKPLNNNRNLSV